MTVAVIAIAGALLILAYWALILWIGGRLDRPHLERERLERVFDKDRR